MIISKKVNQFYGYREPTVPLYEPSLYMNLQIVSNINPVKGRGLRGTYGSPNLG